MRIVFAGTPEFARVALTRLREAGHEIALVLTQPDRPAGRGMKLQASAVKQYALTQGLPIAQPRSLRLDGAYGAEAQAAQSALQAANAQAMVVVAYGLILPHWVLALPQLGCFNIHASLLPRWRGAAPIHRAIEAGDSSTGVTIMQMDAGLDTGDMLLSESLAIEPAHTTGYLHDRLAGLGADMMLEVLALASAGQLQPVPQSLEGVTYAHKIDKAEAAIDWRLDAPSIVRRVNAFNPAPGCTAVLAGEVLKIWRASTQEGAIAATCGEIVALTQEHIDVCAMNSIVRIEELQRPGGKRLGVADFQRGFPLSVGMHFQPVAG